MQNASNTKQGLRFFISNCFVIPHTGVQDSYTNCLPNCGPGQKTSQPVFLGLGLRYLRCGIFQDGAARLEADVRRDRGRELTLKVLLRYMADLAHFSCQWITLSKFLCENLVFTSCTHWSQDAAGAGTGYDSGEFTSDCSSDSSDQFTDSRQKNLWILTPDQEFWKRPFHHWRCQSQNKKSYFFLWALSVSWWNHLWISAERTFITLVYSRWWSFLL